MRLFNISNIKISPSRLHHAVIWYHHLSDRHLSSLQYANWPAVSHNYDMRLYVTIDEMVIKIGWSGCWSSWNWECHLAGSFVTLNHPKYWARFYAYTGHWCENRYHMHTVCIPVITLMFGPLSWVYLLHFEVHYSIFINLLLWTNNISKIYVCTRIDQWLGKPRIPISGIVEGEK